MKLKLFPLTLLLISTCALVTIGQRRPPILDGTIGIPAGNHWRAAFVADDGDRVQGWFRVASKDVICLIMDAENYDLFRKGYEPFVVYNSGKVTAANLNAKLRRGTYYFVLSNQYSVFTSKTVNGLVRLR